MCPSPFDAPAAPAASPAADAVRGMKVVVVGGGNGGMTEAALAATAAGSVTLLFSPKYADRAEALRAAIEHNGGMIIHTKVSEEGVPNRAVRSPVKVTTDASCVAGADVVVVSLPAPAREAAVAEIAPYLRSQLVVFLPGASGGVDLGMLRRELGRRCEAAFASGLTYAASKSLPWSTRSRAPGEMHVRGTKQHMEVALFPNTAVTRFTVQSVLNALHGHSAATTKFVCVEHWLEATYIPFNYCGNPLLHTGIMYGFWRDWDGSSFEETPLFYRGITPLAVQTLEAMWGDLKATTDALATALGLEEPPSALRRLKSVLMDRYSAVVADPSTLFSAFRTNGAYAYTIHPMKKDEASGKLMPNFQARYLVEDIPFGLVAIRGCAELLGVPTPAIDEVIYWAQEKIGKSYLVDGRLTGADVAASGAPQRFGVASAADLLAYVPRDVIVGNLEALASASRASMGADAHEALLASMNNLALAAVPEGEAGEDEGTPPEGRPAQGAAAAAAGAKTPLASPRGKAPPAAQRSCGALDRRLSAHLLAARAAQQAAN